MSRSISRNASYNLVGSLVPIALALFTVPLYLHLVGADRYGILSFEVVPEIWTGC